MIINFDPQFIDSSKSLKDVAFIKNRAGLSDRHYTGAIGLIVRLGIVLDKVFLSRFKCLKFIASITTGTDHIDEKYCKERRIKIISLKGEKRFLQNIYATPEHTWALLLALIRNIPWAFDCVCRGNWSRINFFGRELHGKRFGIIGFGRIGKILSLYGHAFGMDVVFYDIRKIKGAGNFVRPLSLKRLLRTSDVISVNIPLNDKTRHFIKAKHFMLMKKNTILLNTSRGAVVDESALLKALRNGLIAGAALDVLEGENIKGKISKKHPLIRYAGKNRNLIISPHIAGSTYESMRKTSYFISKRIKTFLKKRGI
jgi:D-3-phosphoglycerate dehydrogenase